MGLLARAAPTALLALLPGLGLAVGVTPVRAATTAIELRIEGRTEALVERPLAAEGEQIQASSDSQPRTCDGINPNEPEELTPGATPTAAAVEAMAALGQTFDGHWNSGYDDYLITRWGAEAESGGESWSLFVNDTLSSVGGCQFELPSGSEVIWNLALPTSRPMLTLYPAGSTSAAPALTATATLGTPFAIEVLALRPKSGHPPAAPSRTGFEAFAGAQVAPVETSAGGTEKPLTTDPSTVTTNAEGRATITFTTPGWHRIMAAGSGAIRSNRIDVCVPSAGTSSCGATPSEDLLPGGEAPVVPTQGAGQTTSSGSGSTTTAGSSTGTSGRAGGPSAAELHIGGLTLAPLAFGSSALRLAGHWHLHHEIGAWSGASEIGSRGCRLIAVLAAGRPAFVLRRIAGGTRVELEADGRRRVYRLPKGAGPRLLLGWKRPRRGTVRLRVLGGSLAVNAVAVRTSASPATTPPIAALARIPASITGLRAREPRP